MRVVAGDIVTGSVMVLARQDFSCGVAIALVSEQESICAGKKEADFQVIQYEQIGEIVAGISHWIK